jgi:hypothetical protein
MDNKPELRLIRGSGGVLSDGQHTNHPAHFFRYKDASNFHDLTKPNLKILKGDKNG